MVPWKDEVLIAFEERSSSVKGVRPHATPFFGVTAKKRRQKKEKGYLFLQDVPFHHYFNLTVLLFDAVKRW